MHAWNRVSYTRTQRDMPNNVEHVYVYEDEEYDDEELSPINWIPGIGISSGCGSGSGSSGSIYFWISRSLKNVDRGYEIVKFFTKTHTHFTQR